MVNGLLCLSHIMFRRHIGGEVVARIPKQILECENVSRVVQFKSLYPIVRNSKNEITDFRKS